MVSSLLGIAVHTDAAQSIGKVAVRVDEMGVDMLSVCAHKLYAPKGEPLPRIKFLAPSPAVPASCTYHTNQHAVLDFSLCRSRCSVYSPRHRAQEAPSWC